MKGTVLAQLCHLYRYGHVIATAATLTRPSGTLSPGEGFADVLTNIAYTAKLRFSLNTAVYVPIEYCPGYYKDIVIEYTYQYPEVCI